MAKTKKVAPVRVAPKEVTKVAEQIGDLVEAASKAADLEIALDETTTALEDTQNDRDRAQADADALMTEIKEITQKDLDNLRRIQATVHFETKFASGLHQVRIVGSGRWRMHAQGPTLMQALVNLRPLVAKIS